MGRILGEGREKGEGKEEMSGRTEDGEERPSGRMLGSCLKE